jgi:hypothetical protein
LKVLTSELPKVGNRYVVQGDLLVTKDELRRLFVKKHPKPTRKLEDIRITIDAKHDLGKKKTSLLDRLIERVMLVAGTDPVTNLPLKWTNRHLSYWVDEHSFRNLLRIRQVNDHMAAASSDWEAACTHCQVTLKKTADKAAATFIVRYENLPTEVVATSFFPNSAPADRLLLVGDAFFGESPLDPTGVLRHELGHVLGYRHEDLQDPEGCIRDETDTHWVALSPPDKVSVMHYYCGTSGTTDLLISEVDKAMHRLYYGPQAEPTAEQLREILDAATRAQ